MPLHILFVCLGNICRSCTAEEIFRTKARQAGLADRYVIDSAGLIDYHEGELPDSRMRAAALHRGYKLTHRSRPVTTADFDRFDLIIGMDGRNRERLLHLAPTPGHRSKVVLMGQYLPAYYKATPYIPDPYYGTEADFRHVVTLLEDACDGLLKDTHDKTCPNTATQSQEKA